MGMLNVPARWDQMEAVYDYIDGELTRQGCPTILRLRMATVIEELFFSVLDTAQPVEGQLECSVGPERGMISCRLLLPEQVRPDYSALEILLERMRGLGVAARRRGGDWQFILGRRPEDQTEDLRQG